MPKITAISPQKRKGRFNVYIDGEFAFGVDEDTLVQEGLVVGKEISELEIQELEEKSEVGKLYQKALRFLEYRPRSEREVRGYLKKKLATPLRPDEHRGYGGQATEDAEVVVEQILKRLKSLNYLNDLEFAKWWVEQRRGSSKPRGVKAIRSELYQKGVARAIIEEILKPGEKLITEGTEVELAMRAAQKYLKRPKSPKQLILYLARRGFEWRTIKTVVDKLFAKE